VIIVAYTGNVGVEVLYNGTDIHGSPFTWEFEQGEVSIANSLVLGNGFDNQTPLVAGSMATFEIALANKYGIRIYDQALCQQVLSNPSQNISVTINGPGQSAPITYGKCTTMGTVTGYFNLTAAGSYQVSIAIQSNTLHGSPFQITVNPAGLYPQATMVTGLTGKSLPESGNFTILTLDRYGNPVSVESAGQFDVSFSPSCGAAGLATVNCAPSQNIATPVVCTYSVAQGGSYCLQVAYKGEPISVPNSQMLITGGSNCVNTSGCSGQGFCFPNLGNTTEKLGNYTCNCFQGYTGTSCQTKISSHYLAVGVAIGIIVGVALFLFVLGILLGLFVLRRFFRRGEDNRPLIDEHI
jgi:hypothetical protein